MKSHGQHLRRSNKWSDVGETMALVKPSRKHLRRSQCASRIGWRICLLTKCTSRPLIGYFLWNPDLWDIKCEVNPPAITSRKQKVWNGGETWNCTLLRVRSVYLGLAKRRQRRKREKQPKRSPARQWLQRYSRSGTKWRQQKARREGSIQRYVKLCGEGGIGKRSRWEGGR